MSARRARTLLVIVAATLVVAATVASRCGRLVESSGVESSGGESASGSTHSERIPPTLDSASATREDAPPAREPESREVDASPARLAIVVRDEDGHPVSGIDIELMRSVENEGKGAPLAERPAFERSLFIEQHLQRLETNHPLHELAQRVVASRELSRDEFARLVDALFESPGRRRVAEVTFFGRDYVCARGSTNDDGSLDFELAPGTYRVGVLGERNVTFDLGFVSTSFDPDRYKSERSPVVALSDSEQRVLEGVCGGTSLSGRLDLPSPLASPVTITLLRATGPYTAPKMKWSVDRWATHTSEDGRFRFDGLFAGRYSIHAVATLTQSTFAIYEFPFSLERSAATDLGVIPLRGPDELEMQVVVTRDDAEVDARSIFTPPADSPASEPTVCVRIEGQIPREPSAFQFFLHAPVSRPFRVIGLLQERISLGLLSNLSDLERWTLPEQSILRWPARQETAPGLGDAKLRIEVVSAHAVTLVGKVSAAGRRAELRVFVRIPLHAIITSVSGRSELERPFSAEYTLPRGEYEYLAIEDTPHTSDSTGLVASGSFIVADRAQRVEFEMGVGAAAEITVTNPAGEPSNRLLSFVPSTWRGSQGESVFTGRPDSEGRVKFVSLPPGATLEDTTGAGIEPITTGLAGTTARVDRRSQR